MEIPLRTPTLGAHRFNAFSLLFTASFRYFRVDRIENIGHPLPYRRDGREAYQEKNITNQKAKVFDMYGGTEYTVRIRFRNELADAVVDQFGKDVGTPVAPPMRASKISIAKCGN